MSKLSIFILLFAAACGSNDRPAATVEGASGSIYFIPARNVSVQKTIQVAYPRQGYEFVISLEDGSATIDVPGENQYTEQGKISVIAPGEWRTDFTESAGHVQVNCKTGKVDAKINGKPLYLSPDPVN